MKKRGYAIGAGLAFLLLATALTGSPPGALYYVDSECKDGINNDGDVISGGGLIPDVPLIDLGDNECSWMLLDFGNGEYDSSGTAPNMGDVSSFAVTWQLSEYDDYPTYYEAYSDWLNTFGEEPCSYGDAQSILSHYRDAEGISDSRTGVSLHQNECGVSY